MKIKKEKKDFPDLSKVQGSMTQILQDNRNQIDACKTIQELSSKISQLFKDQNLDTPATRRLILNVNKCKNITDGLFTVYNSILAGNKLEVQK